MTKRPDCNTPTETPAELAARTEAAKYLGFFRMFDGVQIPEDAGRSIVDLLAERFHRYDDTLPAGASLQDSCGGPH